MTCDWILRHGGQYDELVMRRAGGRRPDTVVKKEMLDEIWARGYEVLFVVEDRPSVVEMWRANGVPCFAVDDSEWREKQHYLSPDEKEG